VTTAQLSTTFMYRNHPDRMSAAHTVQVRDAEPLIALEAQLSQLQKCTHASGGAVFLSVDEDVPLTILGDFPFEIHFTDEEEDILFSGKLVRIRHYTFTPLRIQGFIVGFLALSGIQAEFYDLADVYAQLMAKELELANQTAKLKYQNESISRKQKQLEQAINFKNNILSLTTHDIRSPLTAVIGYLDMLDQGIKQNQKTEFLSDLHKRIKSGVSNVADLVDQLNEIALLELQRIELNFIKVDLNWLAQEVCDVMQGPALTKKHQLTFNRCEKPLYVEVDIPKIKRVLFNLIHNAIKYTPSGGVISVSLSKEKRMAHVHIKDNGIGIPKDKQEAIFEPFHKLNQYGTNGESATGLGLFTSNYFISLFKGSITVDSTPKVGSEFVVHLPLQTIDF
jgi:signal transduction histidine kinase